MSDAPELLVERRGAAEWLTLNRPERLNALTPTLVDQLAGRFAALREDLSARVIVLQGAGTAFCAGLDIKAKVERDEAVAAGGTDEDKLPAQMIEIITAMRECPQPVVALLRGPAAGGGFAFALAADIRLAGESAFMKPAVLNLGMSGCELGTSYFLPRHVGTTFASEIMLTGRRVDAARALQIGLVSTVVPDDELEQVGQQLVTEMLRATPLGLRKTKETLNRCLDADSLTTVLELEYQAQLECGLGPDFEEGLRAFIEKREPNFA